MICLVLHMAPKYHNLPVIMQYNILPTLIWAYRNTINIKSSRLIEHICLIEKENCIQLWIRPVLFSPYDDQNWFAHSSIFKYKPLYISIGRFLNSPEGEKGEIKWGRGESLYAVHPSYYPNICNKLIRDMSYFAYKVKQKYRGMFETQKSGKKTSSGKRLVSTLEHMQFQKWDRTRCPEK